MKLIYQNPKNDREVSTPIDEKDVMRRNILEGSGWYVLERLEEGEEPSSPVVEMVPDKDLKRLDEELRDRLAAAGYETDAAVYEATDDELLAIEGIGSASLKKIRNGMAEGH